MSQGQFSKYKWAASGDVNAFFGLMLDNIADLVLMVGLLVATFQFPADFALRYMVPGTAIGVLVGDLLFFRMAFATAKRTGNDKITAMPLGLDTPSTFGMVFFVLGPAFVMARESGLSEMAAAAAAWRIGVCSIVISGLFKIVCSFASNKVRQVIPRAGLLGSLASIALVLISFIPFVETVQLPIVGLVALTIILLTLVARVPLPGKIPGALGALLVSATVFYIMKFAGWLPSTLAEPPIDPQAALLPYEWLTVFKFEWLQSLKASMSYMPIVIPFALGTVVGGIDCTESASAAGDEFDTGAVIRVEAFATLIAGLCGGVIQTTPYIGHPAYKAMGGRAAYTLATAIFVGAAGLLGFFGYLYVIIPQPTVFPILIFIGLEITAQSFLATPNRHYPAVALACVPALATLAAISANRLLPFVQGLPPAELHHVATLNILANGFIVTSLLWASLLAAMIDRRLFLASAYAGIAAACTLFGVIHSPLAAGAMFLPWNLPSADLDTVLRFTIGYALSAGFLLACGFLTPKSEEQLKGKEQLK